MRKITARRKSYFGEKKNVWFVPSLNSKALARGALKTILRFTAKKMLIDVQFNNMFWLRGLDVRNLK